MFDSYSNSNSRSNSVLNSSIKINAVSGNISKSCTHSWFEKFHLNSERAKELFDPLRPYDRKKRIRIPNSKKVYDSLYGEWRMEDTFVEEWDLEQGKSIILQMVIVGDNEVIAELVRKENLQIEIKQEEEVKV